MYCHLHVLCRNSMWFLTKPCTNVFSLITHRFSHLLYGPDQIIPTKDRYTTKPDGHVRVRRENEGVAALPPISVPGLLHLSATKYPDKVALVSMDKAGEYVGITYHQYEQEVRTCAKAFIKLGLERFHSVAIIGYNAHEWIISDLAAIYAGGFATGMYTTSTPLNCQIIADTSRANILVVQDDVQLHKILEIKDKLPRLKHIIQFEGKSTISGVLNWQEVMKLGSEQSDEKLDFILRHISVNECCTLIYTSGTTGNPKAVMLSHDNLTWTGRMIAEYMEAVATSETLVSYLPLSHVAAQVLDIYTAITIACTLYFGDKNALKGSIIQTVKVARPTVFLAVPRVWEKISEKVLYEMNRTTGLKKSIVLWAQKAGLEHNMKLMKGDKSFSPSYALANALIFSKLKKKLGFDRCKSFMNGAAPLSTVVKLDCWSIDLLVMEGYGMSETAGCQTLCKESAFRINTIGRTLPGCNSSVALSDEIGSGELVFKGRNIFMGYMNDLKSTEETFNKDLWLASGDLGNIDKEGFLFITGRAKEVVITAGGENIPPTLIENNIKAELPCLSNVVLIGDKRRFLTVLVTMRCERDPEGDSLDNLDLIALLWCEEIGCKATKLAEVVKDPVVHVAIHEGIQRANLKVLSHAQRVQNFTILPKDFSVSTGEFGPTMKLKRKFVLEKYKDVIDDFYHDVTAPVLLS